MMEEPEKVPDWLNTGITYLLQKSGEREQESQEPPNHYMLNNHVQNRNKKNSQNNFHTSGRTKLITTRAKTMSPGSNDCKDQLIVSKAIHED